MGKKDNDRRNPETDRKAQEAKQKAQAAARQNAEQRERQRNRDRNGGRQSAPQQQQQQLSVKAGVQQVGDKLSKGEAKDLRQQGYSVKQIGKIAGKVERTGAGATKVLERWQANGGRDGRGGGRPSSSGIGGGGGGRPGGGAAGGLTGNDRERKPGKPGISAGGSYGTTDRNGWLAAELNAIDTFRPDTTPTLFNSYRPTDLSAQLRDAVAEANNFIDSRGQSSSSGSATTASVTPTSVMPASLLDEEEQRKYGLGF